MKTPTLVELLSPMRPCPRMVARFDTMSPLGLPQHALCVAAVANLWPTSEATRVYGRDAVKIINSKADPRVRARDWWASLPQSSRDEVVAWVRSECAAMLFDLGSIIAEANAAPTGPALEVLHARTIAWVLRRDDIESFEVLVRGDSTLERSLQVLAKELDDQARPWLSPLLAAARAYAHPQILASLDMGESKWWMARAHSPRAEGVTVPPTTSNPVF